ncbi:MAG TPA: glycosyltransferase, partial [Candidatus Babeliales bacterium]|nr:glycosyltransferase [Candidatus Babeliales bacterium]
TEQRCLLRKQLAIEDTFVFCFVGTFSRWHGIELLASAIPAIVAQRPHVHFLFVGDGPLRPFLQQELIKQGIASENVTFTGLVPQRETKYYLAAADAYVCPTQPNPDGSRFFGSPTKVFEYLSMGKPILASNLEQLTEIFDPALTSAEQSVTNEVGFLFDPASTLSFIEGAIAITDLNQQDYQKLGSNARDRAIAQYQWLDHVAKLAAIMNAKKDDQSSLIR